MIISRTPYRISLVGGGTDLPEFFENDKGGGSVISFPIDKYIHICINNLFEANGYFLKYSEIERIGSINQIKHKIIYSVFKKYNIKNVDFNSIGDFPSGTGMGSSSVFTVGLLNAVKKYNKMQDCSQEELAKEACEIEVDILNEPIGFQDQYGSALGGIKKISFKKNRTISIDKIEIKNDEKKKLNENTMLFYIGNERSASKILKNQGQNTLKEDDTKNSLRKMKSLADELAVEISNNVDSVGEYLHQNWLLKRNLTKGITSNYIDEIYQTGIDNGALGGKLLGAGAGGFLLFYCPVKYQYSLKKSFSKLKFIDFKIDELGATIAEI